MEPLLMRKRAANQTRGAKPPRVERRRGMRGIRDTRDDSEGSGANPIDFNDVAFGEMFVLRATADTSCRYKSRRMGVGVLRRGGSLHAAAIKLSRRCGRSNAGLTSIRGVVLGALLKSVSLTAYLTLRVLPAAIRAPMGITYLLGRAAFGIANASPISHSERLDLLSALHVAVSGEAHECVFSRIKNAAWAQTEPGEIRLLKSIDSVLAAFAQLDSEDRRAVSLCVATRIEAVQFDVRAFPGTHAGCVVALRDMAELERYAYLKAGCVGEFWAKMAYADAPRPLRGEREKWIELGVRLGKALQITRVLRDGASDLGDGRCYFPRALLEQARIGPHDLLLPDASSRAWPILSELVYAALAHYRSGLRHMLTIAHLSVHARLACAGVIAIGLNTLLHLVESEAWLAAKHTSRLQRISVCSIVVSLAAVPSNPLLLRRAERVIARIEARLASG